MWRKNMKVGDKMVNLVLHTVGQFMAITGIIVPWLVGVVIILTWLVDKIMSRREKARGNDADS